MSSQPAASEDGTFLGLSLIFDLLINPLQGRALFWAGFQVTSAEQIGKVLQQLA